VRRAELIRYWLPAAFWSAVLLLMSGNLGSSGLTFGVLGWIVSPDNPMFDAIHFLLRKTGHLLAYGLLGALDFRAVRGTRGGWYLRWSVIAVVLAVLIAAIDEWHQTTVPGRTGVPTDVVIDAAGATLAQIVYRLAVQRPRDFRDEPAR
jgi:VanZ family protein